MKKLCVLILISAIVLFPGILMAQYEQLHLPFPSGVAYRCVQGVNGDYSHQDIFTKYDLDFDTPNNSDEIVIAPVSGIAYVHLDNSGKGFGNHINIDIGNNLFVMVGHLKSFSIEDGAAVVCGQYIGIEGSTGFSQGDHIHFGLHRGSAKEDAMLSESIEAFSISAKDITNGDVGYANRNSKDFVGDLYAGHFYESDNDYGFNPLLVLCPTGFQPSNGSIRDPSAVFVLGDSGWHPLVREVAWQAFLARLGRQGEQPKALTQEEMAQRNPKIAWDLDIDDIIVTGLSCKYLPGYCYGYDCHDGSTVFYFNMDKDTNKKNWHPLVDPAAMTAFGIKDADIIYPDKSVLDYYCNLLTNQGLGQDYSASDASMCLAPQAMPDGIGGAGQPTPPQTQPPPSGLSGPTTIPTLEEPSDYDILRYSIGEQIPANGDQADRMESYNKRYPNRDYGNVQVGTITAVPGDSIAPTYIRLTLNSNETFWYNSKSVKTLAVFYFEIDHGRVDEDYQLAGCLKLGYGLPNDSGNAKIYLSKAGGNYWPDDYIPLHQPIIILAQDLNPDSLLWFASETFTLPQWHPGNAYDPLSPVPSKFVLVAEFEGLYKTPLGPNSFAICDYLNLGNLTLDWVEDGLLSDARKKAEEAAETASDTTKTVVTADTTTVPVAEVQPQPQPVNLIANADQLTSWQKESRQGYDPNLLDLRLEQTDDNKPCLVLENKGINGEYYYAQLQTFVPVQQGRNYELTFKVKASSSTWTLVEIMRLWDYQNLGCAQTISLTTDWQSITVNFTATADNPNARLSILQIGHFIGRVSVVEPMLIDLSDKEAKTAVGEELNADLTLASPNSIIGDKGLLVYPNPFNYQIQIIVKNLKEQNLSLEVYNVLGQKVKTLIADEPCQITSMRFIWQGDNDFSQPLASGRYFLVLRNHHGKSITKVVIFEK